MIRHRLALLLWIGITLVVALAAALVAAGAAEHRAFDALRTATTNDARLRAALFDSEVARYRLLPLALADDRDVVAGIVAPSRDERLNRKLEAMAAATGAPVIYVVAPDGHAVAASNWRTPRSFVGRDYRFRGYYRDARANGDGEQFARGTVSGRSGLYLSRRTATGGVTVVKLEFDAVERAWAAAGGITIVTGPEGVVLVSSRPGWRYAATRPLAPETRARVARLASIDPATLRPLAMPAVAGGRGVRIDGRRFVVASAPARAERGWTLVLLRPADPGTRLAAAVAAIGAALLVLFLSAAIGFARRRRGRARRRTAELEHAVAERTADLEREMAERAASEAHAATLREGLRQANRLASLGQITASVAHETAQPVAAIRTYARTSAILLDGGDLAGVRENLATIAGLSDRIGAVTAELRGFARRGTRELRPVPLADVLDGAMLILRDQAKAIAVDLPEIDPALAVVGGRTRLEQVIVNILQNAIEALGATPRPTIAITIFESADTVRLTIADNGPGIPPPVAERLFTPFVTSRENGLGLGLVIAQDIMADLGGTLRLVPAAMGATFEIAMRRA